MLFAPSVSRFPRLEPLPRESFESLLSRPQGTERRANYKGEMYNMPFNMNTFSRMWGISTPEEAKKIINEQRKVIKGEPKNLEEQAISLVGTHTFSG